MIIYIKEFVTLKTISKYRAVFLFGHSPKPLISKYYMFIL